jgi:hypothetical protein
MTTTNATTRKLNFFIRKLKDALDLYAKSLSARKNIIIRKKFIYYNINLPIRDLLVIFVIFCSPTPASFNKRTFIEYIVSG